MTRRWHIGSHRPDESPFHPNAAKVFLNRFLSLEGQIAFRQANVDELRVGSMPEDLPQKILTPLARRHKDKQYLFVNRPEWMDFKPIQHCSIS